MAKWMRKIGVDLIDAALSSVSGPGYQEWRNISARALKRVGKELYDTELVPGLEESTGENVFMLPELDVYESTGDPYAQREDLEAMNAKSDLVKAKKLLFTGAKLAEETGIYQAGAVPPYPEGSPVAEKYRESRIADAFTNIDSSFMGESSETPPVGIKNAWMTPMEAPYERKRVIETAFLDHDVFNDAAQEGLKWSSADFSYPGEPWVETTPPLRSLDGIGDDPNAVESRKAWRDFRAFDADSNTETVIDQMPSGG